MRCISYWFFLFFSLFLVIIVVKSQTIITVDSQNGCNIPNCLLNEKEPCMTLDHAINNMANSNTVIKISSFDKQYLSVNTTLQDKSNIQLLSDSIGFSQVYCNDSDIGLFIINVSNLIIKDIAFSRCGAVNSFNDSLLFRVGVYIRNNTNVTISNVNITNNLGTGLMLLDTLGPVLIEKSTFEFNSIPEEERNIYHGGSALYIAFTTPSITTPSTDVWQPNDYTISQCDFQYNIASLPSNETVTYMKKTEPVLESFGLGGGLSISLNGNSTGNTFIIEGCHFEGNTAEIGGGLSIQINDQSSHNKFIIIGDEKPTLFKNHAKQGGGGIQFGFFHTTQALQNNITFIGVSFQFNEARYGGGLSLYSSRIPFGIDTFLQNIITFQDCHWWGNKADLGAALILFPEDWALITDGYLPTPLFIDCTFTGNIIYFEDEENSSSISKVQFSNGGILFSDTFSIKFLSSISFESNEGSGVHMLAGNVDILPNTSVIFNNNKAFRGAGIALMSYATIVAHKNTSITFVNNTATDVGGGLYYYTSDNLDFVNSRRCFIHYEKTLPPNEWETNITFITNHAKYGSAIYAESLEPCARANNMKGDTSQLFRWESFNFEPDFNNNSHVISTGAKEIIMNDDEVIMSPGIPTSINIIIIDDFNQRINPVLQASCETIEGNISGKTPSKIPEQYKYISDDYQLALLNGTREIDNYITLQTLDSRSIGIRFKVTISPCPPGYVMKKNSCICSVSNNKHIPGIISCNETSTDKHALMMIGYWAGCDGNGLLLTGQCPLGYCNYSEFLRAGFVSLPNTCESLNGSLCMTNREGIMCGKCAENFSVHYHSTRFMCGDCHGLAHLGPLFYILSELLPLTIVFIVVIAFDVSVTSGAVNSFILYAQLLDFFQVTAFGSYNSLQETLQYLTKIYWFLFGFLNLDFFRLDSLSFCLWEGTNVLDVLIFKYVTTLYGLLLIAILFFILKYCNCTCLTRCLSKINRNEHYSIVHGISTFLIITYSQVTKVSFQILTLFGIHGSDNLKVVFLSGETGFFSKEHLPYALIAIFVLMTYAFLPPFILIVHPLYLMIKKVLTEKKLINEEPTGRCQWMTRLSLFCKPTLDAFQSCFKDRMRFFAGLFFLYRLFASLAFAFSQTAISMYFLLELVVLLMLTINAIFQPYEKRYYNILDTLMFANLAIINGISLFKTISNQFYFSENDFSEIAIIQVILIYIPLVYICLFLGFKIIANKSRLARYKLRNINQYIPLYNPQLLVRDEQERERLLPQDEDEHSEGSSFTTNNYPARLFGASITDTETDDGATVGERRMNRDLRSGRNRHGYGALDLSNRHTK